MSVAERARAAVRREPFLLDALRAGVVNYSAAARHLDVDGDEESVATALRRFAEELDGDAAGAGTDRRASVRLHRGVGLAERGDDADEAAEDPSGADQLLAVGDVALRGDGDLTAVHASGDVDARALERVLGVLRGAEIAVAAAAVAEDELLVAVGGRAGPDALRLVEDAL